MKKTILLMAGILLSFLTITVQAQQTWESKKNPTVDSITHPFEGKLLPPRAAMTIEQVFPVLGQYESSVNKEAPALKIRLDEENKGIVWIEGLPQGTIKAMLRKSPATYKIPAQKTEDGKEVAEGTLIYDKDAKTLSICIGKLYNAEYPSKAFVPASEEIVVADPKVKVKTTKTKVVAAPKPWIYVGTKVETATALKQ